MLKIKFPNRLKYTTHAIKTKDWVGKKNLELFLIYVNKKNLLWTIIIISHWFNWYE